MFTDDERPMPPVSSRQDGGAAGGGDGRMAPPFVGQPAAAAPSLAAMAPPELEETPWEGEEEGTVEPVFEADVMDTEAKLAALSHVAPRGEAEFPMDAFIIPEHTRRLPTGIEAQPVHAEPTQTPLTDLADRLEKLSHRLRVEGADATIARLSSGDRTDVMIADLLSGILASSQ